MLKKILGLLSISPFLGGERENWEVNLSKLHKSVSAEARTRTQVFWILHLVCAMATRENLGESGGETLCGGSRTLGPLEASLGSPFRNLTSSCGLGLRRRWGSAAENTSRAFHMQISTISTPCNNSEFLAIKPFVLKITNTSFWWQH